MMVGRWSFVARAALVATAAGLAPRAANAMVTQPPPGNEVMPQTTPAAEISVITSRGFAADAVTLAGLFKYTAGPDSAIDPIRDAQTTPGTFSPACGFTATMVLDGGGCKLALGWYNATEPAILPAAIYPFVPANRQPAPPNGLSCADNDFCPLATRTSTQAAHTWVDPLYAFDPGIRSDPNWAGGKIGLALIGQQGAICSQTKYSQAELNDRSPSGAPWVSVLVYQSVAEAAAHYLAFENSPTCAQSWRGCTGGQPNQAGNGSDGDFNDAVYYVRETVCSPDGGAPDGAGGGGAGGAAGTGGRGGANGSAGASGAGGVGGSSGAGTGGGAGAPGGTTGSAGTSGGAGTTGGLTGASGAAGVTGTGGIAGATSSGGVAGTTGAGGTTGIGGTAVTGAPKSESGCGCSVASERGVVWPLLLALAVLFGRQRRRVLDPARADARHRAKRPPRHRRVTSCTKNCRRSGQVNGSSISVRPLEFQKIARLTEEPLWVWIAGRVVWGSLPFHSS